MNTQNRQQFAQALIDNNPTVRIFLVDNQGNVYNQENEIIQTIDNFAFMTPLTLVTELRKLRKLARLSHSKLVECGICANFHPSDFNGDCRDDGSRFPAPDDPNQITDQFDDGTPGANAPPTKTALTKDQVFELFKDKFFKLHNETIVKLAANLAIPIYHLGDGWFDLIPSSDPEPNPNHPS